MSIAEIIGENEYYYPEDIAEAIIKNSTDEDVITREREALENAIYRLRTEAENPYNYNERILYKFLYKLASVTE